MLALAVGQVQAAASTGWRGVYLSHFRHGNLLLGIAAPSKNDAWAVGEYTQQPGPIILHWNGKYWRSVRVPGAGPAFEPASVYATSPADIWIFGSIWRNGDDEALRWNGSVWQVISIPTGTIGLNETAVLSPSSIWAVEAGVCPARCSSPASYWDGQDWSTPQVNLDIWAIAAAGGHADVLAVTHYRTQDQTFVPVLYERVNGRWRRCADLNRRLTNPVIAADSSHDVWIWGRTPGRAQRGLLYHWDGHKLRSVAVPSGLYTNDGLTADGYRGVWAGPYAHWTGRKWISLRSAVGRFNGMSTALAPVPGTGTTWLAGWVPWHGRAESFVAVNGTLP